MPVKLLGIDVATALTERDAVEAQIIMRLRLIDQVVGWLYPLVLRDEIFLLRKRSDEIMHAGLSP